jgi:hypothetical protein
MPQERMATNHLEDRVSLEEIIALQKLLEDGIPKGAEVEDMRTDDGPKADTNKPTGGLLKLLALCDGPSVKAITRNANSFVLRIIQRLGLLMKHLCKTFGRKVFAKRAT